MTNQANNASVAQSAKGKSEQRQKGAAILAAVFVCIGMFFCFQSNGWQFGLLLALPAALISVYYAFSPDRRTRWQSWLINHVVIITAIVILWGILLALIPWGIVNFWWLPMYERQQPLVILVEGKSIQLSASLPGGVFADGLPQPIPLHFTNDTPVTQTVTTTLQLSATSSLAVVRDTQQVVSIGPNREVTKTLFLANKQPPLGDWKEEVVMVTAVINDEPSISRSTTLRVEGKFGAGLRRFVTKTVNTASPLIILVAFLITSISPLLQKYVQTYQAEQAAEKEAAEARQKEKHKREASEAVAQIRKHLRTGNLKNARAAYARGQQNEGLKDNFPNEQHIATDLLALAELKDLAQVDGQILSGRGWPNACIAAFVAAWEHCRNENDSENCVQVLAKARNLLPVAQAEPDMQNALVRIALEIVAYEKRRGEFAPTKDWPPPPRQPAAPETVYPWIKDNIPNGKDPFAHEKAEADCYYLFHTDGEKQDMAFWGGHALFNALFHVDRPTLVFGAAGSGRSTLAQAIHYYAPRREVFALHLPGRPQPETIRRRFAAHLFNFVLLHSSYLRLLTDAERSLLAQLLAQTLGKAIVSARIESRQAQLLGLQDAASPTEIGNEQVSNSEQLQLLHKAVTDASLQVRQQVWTEEIGAVASALKFKRTLLVLDLDTTEASLDWLKTTLPELLDWHAVGLTAVLFLPNALLSQVNSELGGLYLRRLVWRRDDFSKMLSWRYKSFSGRYQALEQHFAQGAERNALEDLIDACRLTEDDNYNPQRYVQLWQQIVATLPAEEELITAEAVTKAAAARPVLSIPIDETSVKADRKIAAGRTLPAHLLATWKQPDMAVLEREINDGQLLRNILANYFSLSELRTLCFDFKIDYENFPANKADMIREMVRHFDNVDLLDDLWLEVCRRRPHACMDGV